MANVNRRSMRLLGFAPLDGLDALQAALAAAPGPALRVCRGPGVAALMQAEPGTGLMRRGRKALLTGLHCVQRRLELACQAGAFLPMDPAGACCPAAETDALLAAAWPGLAAALARHGATQQWDVVLRWPAEAALAPHRDAVAVAAAGGGAAGLAEAVAACLRSVRAERERLLTAALAPAVLGCAPGGPAGTETELSVTVLVPSGGEARLEAALGRLDPADFVGASLDLRGPLPPLSFAAVRMATVEPGEVASAWHQLGLPARVTGAELHRSWRRLAAEAHPDRHPGDEAAAAQAVGRLTAAWHVLRGLLADDADGSLAELLARAGRRLVLPVPAQGAAAVLETQK